MQRTQLQAAKPTTAYDDSKPNSKDVPDAIAQTGRFERIVAARFKFNTDLLEGLEKVVDQEKITNAVILAGTGSVRGYHVHVVRNRDFPSKKSIRKIRNIPQIC